MTYSRLQKWESEPLSSTEQWMTAFGGEKLTFPFFPVFLSPVAVCSIAPFLGPVVGPLISGFINQVSQVSVRRIDFPEDGATIITYFAFFPRKRVILSSIDLGSSLDVL